MDGIDSTRRRLLSLVGTGAVVAGAGCLGGTDTSGGGGGGPTTAGDTTTDGGTGTTTDTTTQDTTMSTVFHFSGTAEEQKHAVANVANLLEDDSVSLGNVTLVANGAGIKLLVQGDSTVADQIQTLMKDGVVFRACHNSMKAFGIGKSDLLSSKITVVPSGVGALTELQAKKGYAYIKTP